MIHYFHGEDTYAAREAITELAETAGARVHWLDRQDLELKPFEEWVGQAKGLFGLELLVVRDVSAFPASVVERVLQVIEKDVEPVVVLWDRTPPDRRSVLWRAMKKYARTFNSRDVPTLVQWVQKIVGERGGAIEAEAARELVMRLGADRWRMIAEVERLLLYASSIDTDLVRQEVVEDMPEDIFVVLQAVARREAPAAMAGVERLLAAGAAELYVLSMLAYQFRTLLAIREGLDRDGRAEDIAREKKLPVFVVRKNLAQARSFTQRQLLDILTKILACDFAIKQGKIDMRTALLMLMLGLVRV